MKIYKDKTSTKQFLVALQKSLLENKAPDFSKFPQKATFDLFYVTSNQCVNILIRRTLTLIPIIPDKIAPHNIAEYRRRAVEYVDEHLQFSLNALSLNEYKECTSNVEKSLFFCEVIKCLILTDVYAKMIYYKKTEQKYWTWNEREFYGEHFFEHDIENHKYTSRNLFELEMKLYEQKSELMDARYEEYDVLTNEDIAEMRGHFKTIEFEGQTIFGKDMPLKYAACLSNNGTGFVGMIYTSLKSTPSTKSLEVYGIRTTIFGLTNGEKGIAKDLFNGVFQYAKLLQVPLVHVSRPALGPMPQILENIRFNRNYKNVDTYTEPNSVNLVDMGCRDEIVHTGITSKHYDIYEKERNF